MRLLNFVIFCVFLFAQAGFSQEIPKFDDKVVNQYVNEYSLLSKKIDNLKSNSDLNNIIATSSELSKKGIEIFKNLKQQDSEKLAKYIETIYAKIEKISFQDEKNLPKDFELPIEKRNKLSDVKGISLPTFDNQILNEYVNYYAHYINDFIKYGHKYDKIMEERGQILTEIATKATKNISEEDAKKLALFSKILNQKIDLNENSK